MGFTLEMHGAYLLALLLQFNSGPFSEDKIKNIVGDTWHSISSKFKEKKGLYYNERLKDEIERRLAYSESRRKNVSKRYNKEDKPLSEKKISDLHMKVHKNLHMETRTRARNRTRNKDVIIIPNHLKDLWDDYLITRKNKKAAKTNSALQRILNKLEKLAPGDHHKQHEILQKSVDSGWTDVYSLKQDRNLFLSKTVNKFEYEKKAEGKYGDY